MSGPAIFVVAMFGGLVAQRLLELRLARRNEASTRARGAVEHGAGHYPLFFVLHTGWLLAWFGEAWWRGPMLSDGWPLWLTAFVAAQGLRYWAIATLGPRWNTRILVVPGEPPIRRGPYRWLSHPNYLAVVLELWCVPAIFAAWTTAIVAGTANLLLLGLVRIPAETAALRAAGPDTPDASPDAPS